MSSAFVFSSGAAVGLFILTVVISLSHGALVVSKRHCAPLNTGCELHKSSVPLPSSLPPLDPIQALVHTALLNEGDPTYSMEDLRGHLHRIKSIKLPSGDQLLLKLSPPTNTELLRQQRFCLHTEAFTFSLLAKSRLPIPRVVVFDAEGLHLGSPFLLTTHLPGICLANVCQYLTRSEHTSIERQLSSIAAIVRQHTSSRFGRAGIGKGHETWREAFSEMLESVLMDGEDKSVSLPYAQIREVAGRYTHVLDEVKEAHLIILGLGSPENVLISRRTNEVTGLTDFSRAVWGDSALVETGGYKNPRKLLYMCYEAIVTIVSNHYRVSDGSNELDARKILTATLMELSDNESRA